MSDVIATHRHNSKIELRSDRPASDIMHHVRAERARRRAWMGLVDEEAPKRSGGDRAGR